MIRRPPRSTRTDTLFPTRRSADLAIARHRIGHRALGAGRLLGAGWRRSQAGERRDGTAIALRHACRRYPDRGGDADQRSRRFRADHHLWRDTAIADRARPRRRSEEHTSELQSLMRISYAVFCLKKKIKTKMHTKNNTHISTASRTTQDTT